jgi:hypothetical protein
MVASIFAANYPVSGDPSRRNGGSPTGRTMRRFMLMSVLALLPTAALAQTQTIKIDCTAYHKNLDGLWTITRPNIIVLDGKPISVQMTDACCFGSDSKRLILDKLNIINIVEKAC